MNDDTAPERIWAGPDEPDDAWGTLKVFDKVFWETPQNSAPDDREGLTEYIRADLVPDTNALIAAALEMAAHEAAMYWGEGYHADRIRALTPAAAREAYDALVKRAEKAEKAEAERDRLRARVWSRLGECVAASSHADISPRARKWIETAIRAALKEGGRDE